MKLLLCSLENLTNVSDPFLRTGCAISLLGKIIANIWVSHPAFLFLLTSKSINQCLLTATGAQSSHVMERSKYGQVFHPIKEGSAVKLDHASTLLFGPSCQSNY